MWWADSFTVLPRISEFPTFPTRLGLVGLESVGVVHVLDKHVGYPGPAGHREAAALPQLPGDVQVRLLVVLVVGAQRFADHELVHGARAGQDGCHVRSGRLQRRLRVLVVHDGIQHRVGYVLDQRAVVPPHQLDAFDVDLGGSQGVGVHQACGQVAAKAHTLLSPTTLAYHLPVDRAW